MLEEIRQLIRAALEERKTAKDARDASLEAATTAKRDLTPAETDIYQERKTALAEIDGRIETLRARETELVEAERRDHLAEQASRDLGEPQTERVSVGNEERTYRPDGDHSFFRDAFHGTKNGDWKAQERLRRNFDEQREHLGTETEKRAVGTAAFGALVVPQYLVDEFAEVARDGRPFANAVRRLPMPADGMTFNIPRGTTGTATAVQANEGDALQNTDFDETTLAVSVRTIGGQQDISRQAIERGTNVDTIIYADLVADYAQKLDSHLINHATDGFLNVAGINAVTYTDASPTLGELYPKAASAIGQVGTGRKLPATLLLMTPLRWAWATAAVDSNGRPLVVPIAPVNPIGVGDSSKYGQLVGSMLGLPVMTDGNVPTNLGAGTNEDRVAALRAFDHILWEDGDGMPRELRFEEPNGGNLQVKLVVYNYIAYTAGRYPKATSVIAGTGLVTPTF